MSDLITRTARLVPYAKRPKQVPSFVTAYSYEPLADEPGAQLGNLYVVMEVLVSGRASEEVADLIIETIGDQYYNQSGSADPLTQFESAIKAVNHELSDYVNRGNAAWIGKLSTAIAIQVDAEVHIAQSGSAEAFLYRGKAVTQISGSGPNRPSTPNKTFGSIATGQLEPGDRLLLATPALIHQVPLSKLQDIVGGSGPNAAIAEITQLLRGASIERIAALVIEITTPELAALQVRSEQPDEIQLGSPENALEAAKIVAAPIAQTTVAHSKKVATAAHVGWQKAKPHAKAAGLTAAEGARKLLATKGGRRIALIVIACVVLVGLLVGWRHNAAAQALKTFDSYQASYQQYLIGQEYLTSGNTAQAGSSLTASYNALTKLTGDEKSINAKLLSSKLPEEPSTFSSLYSLVSSKIDQSNGVVRVQPTTVVSFAAHGSRPAHFELFEGSAYVFDSGNNSALSIVNVTTGVTKSSSANTSQLGDIVSTTLSSANDGIYILTAEPSVWFYRFNSDTLTRQTMSYDTWPKASQIASYASNLYLLGQSEVYKTVRSAVSYSPKINYIDLSSAGSTGSTGLAVDGSVYVLSPSGLHRYLAGSLDKSASVPSTLPQLTNVRSTANGTVIVGSSPTSDRIGLWVASPTSLEFSKQLVISDIKELYDATYDPATDSVYATVDNRLIRIAVTP